MEMPEDLLECKEELVEHLESFIDEVEEGIDDGTVDSSVGQEYVNQLRALKTMLENIQTEV